MASALSGNIFSIFRGKKMIRNKFIHSIPQHSSILELGPFFKPICTGKNVKYFDILTQEELVQRAKNITTEDNIRNIPFIDYVSPTGDLAIIHGRFDAVISSHVIEHQLDLIDHLQKVSNLLIPGGSYYLFIPDKRYCFDHFNNASSIADIIQAHLDKKQKHSLKSVIEHRALTTHNIASKHWRGDHGKLENTSQKIKAAMEEYHTGAYIDVHAWCFTPDSFAEIVTLLEQMDYIDLAINKIYPTPYKSLEFYVKLEKKTRE